MKVFGIDFGEKRIGISMGTTELRVAVGLMTIEITNNDIDNAIKAICKLVKDYEVDSIVVGLPKNMNNSEGFQVKKVKDFSEKLKESCSKPVEYWDERLTTKEALYICSKELNLSREKTKKRIDKLAAILILQSYLNARYS